MQSQQCKKCAAGTYSLGTGVAFDEWDSLPSGFVTQGVNTNGEDLLTNCSQSVISLSFVVYLTIVHLSPVFVAVFPVQPGPQKVDTLPQTQMSALQHCFML